MKTLADLVSGEKILPGLQTAVFSLGSHREIISIVSISAPKPLMRAPVHVLITSQRLHFHHIGDLGFNM